jgi:hypothetical protein
MDATGESPCRTPVESGPDKITAVDCLKTCAEIEAGTLSLATLKPDREGERVRVTPRSRSNFPFSISSSRYLGT